MSDSLAYSKLFKQTIVGAGGAVLLVSAAANVRGVRIGLVSAYRSLGDGAWADTDGGLIFRDTVDAYPYFTYYPYGGIQQQLPVYVPPGLGVEIWPAGINQSFITTVGYMIL